MYGSASAWGCDSPGRLTSPCRGSPGSPMVSVDAARCAERTTGRGGRTPYAAIATNGTDSAMAGGAAGAVYFTCLAGDAELSHASTSDNLGQVATTSAVSLVKITQSPAFRRNA